MSGTNCACSCAKIDGVQVREDDPMGAMASGIVEVELPAEYKLRNIEETEKVRQCFFQILWMVDMLIHRQSTSLRLRSIQRQLRPATSRFSHVFGHNIKWEKVALQKLYHLEFSSCLLVSPTPNGH